MTRRNERPGGKSDDKGGLMREKDSEEEGAMRRGLEIEQKRELKHRTQFLCFAKPNFWQKIFGRKIGAECDFLRLRVNCRMR